MLGDASPSIPFLQAIDSSSMRVRFKTQQKKSSPIREGSYEPRAKRQAYENPPLAGEVARRAGGVESRRGDTD